MAKTEVGKDVIQVEEESDEMVLLLGTDACGE